MRELCHLLKVIVATVIFDIKNLTFNRNGQLKRFSGIRIESGFLSEKETDMIYEEINFLVHNKSLVGCDTVFQERGANGYDEGMLDIKHIDRAIPDFLDKIQIKKILATVKDEMGLNLRVQNINCYWNQGVQNTRGLHADNHTKDQYKAFIYLTDVLSDLDGPYCYVPDSHLASINRYKCIISNYFNNRSLTNYSTKKHEVKMLKAKAAKGALIISNQNGAHRGWPQGKNNQRALISINLI